MESNKKPLNMLMKCLNKYVLVKLKNGLEYKGRMVQCDNYMNIILNKATEVQNNKPIANYGNIFIRGNNILYVCVDVCRS